MKTITLQSDNFKKGLQVLEDDSKAPFGSARKMLNCIITDRGGIAPRPGTKLLGTHNSSNSAIRGLYNFRKSRGDDDLLTKFYDDEMEFFHPTLKKWARVKDGFTADKVFDYTYTLVNTDNDDFMYFCNAYEEFQRWRGAFSKTTSALTGSETEIPVTSILTSQILLSETATSNSATTLTLSTATWATDMWKNFYIYIPSTGKVRLITGNNGTILTFETLGSGPGNIAFQIRQLAFPSTGTIIYNGTTIDYTKPDVYNELPVASAHATAIDTPVALVPTTYTEAPKGNRIDTLRGRVYVGKVKSGVSRDSSGDVQGSSQASGVFVSDLLDPTDFTFSASRVAGEGDIIDVVYGGGEINDVAAFEDEVAIYKQDYIELVKYTEDVNDTAIRTPLKPGYGSISRIIQGADDHYFMTPDKIYTSLGRVRTKDIKPQTENLAHSIKRLLDKYNNDNFNGIEFNNRIISSHKSSSTVTENDIMLVYNKTTKSFEGIWSLGANNFDTFKLSTDDAAKLVYGEANGANIWNMFEDRKVDFRSSSEVLPYSAVWEGNFFNVLPLKSNIQAVNSIALEGYISANTTFTYKLYKDFETDSSLSFDFGGTEEDFLEGTDDLGKFFSSHPFATTPTGTIGEEESDGRRRFSFTVYFPYIYGQYLSPSISSSGKDMDWEIIRMSYGLKESVSTKINNIKTI